MNPNDVAAEVERRTGAMQNAIRLVVRLRKRVLEPNATDVDRRTQPTEAEESATPNVIRGL
jgi:hypothetical protein